MLKTHIVLENRYFHLEVESGDGECTVLGLLESLEP
jgi:hypothetical protein